MSIGKKILVSVLALVIIIIAGYGLLDSQSTQRGGDESGFRSPGVRTIATLAVVGGSAFITGFGFRDVIGRAVGRRMRNRLKFPAGRRSLDHGQAEAVLDHLHYTCLRHVLARRDRSSSRISKVDSRLF